jgi:16S rRNA (guanine966-N2)-methyltransferase
MRIISGKFRHRKLLPPPPTTRPTSDRARESIFNIIYSLGTTTIEGTSVLDAFAGSGALGFEALSRGAAHVTFLEKNPQTAHILKENIANLDVTSRCSLIVGDAITPPKALHPVSFIFLDPPYDQVLETPCLIALQNQSWIEAKTLIILETSAKRALSLPSNATLIDQRRYGAALISFLKVGNNDATPDGKDGR